MAISFICTSSYLCTILLHFITDPINTFLIREISFSQYMYLYMLSNWWKTACNLTFQFGRRWAVCLCGGCTFWSSGLCGRPLYACCPCSVQVGLKHTHIQRSILILQCHVSLFMMVKSKRDGILKTNFLLFVVWWIQLIDKQPVSHTSNKRTCQ